VLAFGGVFIVVSIGIRMKNKEWLRRAGPFEISEGTLGQTEKDIGFWHQAVLASREETVGLRERVQRAEELIDDLHRLRQNAIVCCKIKG
jgi:hypothetical protein